MANPGVGNRFASVNLNKSYGHASHPNQSNNNGYGFGRGRSGGGGGGGMVVLSRPRSSHKAAPKLSVPPPLNLPSLRKEHEKFDTLGAGGGVGGSVGAGSGARPSSSAVGWSKPSAVVAVESEDAAAADDRPLSSQGVKTVDVVSRGGASSAYMPPSARGGVGGADVSVAAPVEKVSVLRGEDFPSLRATLNAANSQTQKQKDSVQQKHKQGISEEPSGGLREGYQASSEVAMRPQVQYSQSAVDTGGNNVDGDNQNGGSSRPQEQVRKQDDYFPGPLPLVRVSPRSDWADDERDTSHGLTSRSRDQGYSRTEAYWDRDYDFPRNSFMPHKPAQYQFDRRGQRDNDVGQGLSNEVFNADPFARDARAPGRDSREGYTWRNSAGKDAFGSQDVSNDRYNLGARPINMNREMNKENKYTPPQFGGNTKNEHTSGGVSGSRDLGTGRRDQVYKYSGRQQWNNMLDTNNGRGPERDFQERFVSDSNRYRTDPALNQMGSRPSFSGSSKGFSASDHLPNFSRDKRSFSKSEKTYGEDPFLGSTGFDAQDPFSGGILGVIKRKKDSNKQLDFHDPVRESFEAELERVQKIQEQERQRVIEEQERAVEMARREEEESLRVVREQEERQRRLEEEAREAAWRAEQERAEAIQKAEELKTARDEEKQRLMMEEERRKQAAKQKLLELEEKIARRQAESSKADCSAATPGDIMTGVVRDRDLSRADDFASWEDGERMVERITNSASSDSSLSRPFDMGPRAAPVRDGSFGFTDRGKSFNSWRRDIFDNDNNSSFFSADHENGHLSPRRDTAIGGRSFPRKDLYAGQGYMPTRGHYRGGIPEPHLDDISHARGHRWNISEGDPYGRNMELDTEYHENVADKFDVAWGQGQHIQSQGRGGYASFPERLYQNSDLDEFYSYGRSRYPARQPRVLPPPVLSSVHRTNFRSESGCSGSSSYENRDAHFDHALQGDSAAGIYPHAHAENSGTIDDEEQSARNEEPELNRQAVPGCDSQSSLSVSSPPSSPTQLSHDDFDESREFVAVSGVAGGQNISVAENETIPLAGKGNTVTAASSISVGDDEEWAVENNEESQEHDEYDEDVGYHENELHGGQGESGDLTQEFEEMHLEGKDSSDMAENMVLGFDQGVEVGIPSDDYAKSPRLDDSLCVGIQGNVDIMDQNNSFDGRREGQSPDVADVSQHVATSSTSTIADNTEKALEGLVSEPNDASAPTRLSLDPSAAGDMSSCSVLHAQQSVSPHMATDAHSSNQPVVNVGGAQSQGATELPVKLLFGLFSGPSLIPSPVPAIQIGSIQMPLQLHPQVGPPLPHMHASQPPLFQFGQLSYPSPMSQGILSLAPQPVTYVQPNVPHSFPASQVSKGPLAAQNSSSHSSVTNNVPSFTLNSHHFQPSNQSSVCQEMELKEANVLAAPTAESKVMSRQNQVDASRASVCAVRPELGRRTDSTAPSHNSGRNSKPFSHHRGSESRSQGRSSSSQSASNARNLSGSVTHQFSSSRGRRYAYSSRNPGARLTSPANEVSRLDGNGFQRRPRRVTQRFEFRVRQTADGRQSEVDAQSNYDAKDSRTQPRSGVDMDIQSDKGKQTGDSSSDRFLTQDTVSAIENNKSAGKHAATDSLHTSARPEGSLKRNISSENDADAPLQSGVVRVYQQPGIEAPSDEDDFIEVRSKRQMLNDRREQREKEIKAKSSNMRKPQRKARSTPQGTANAARTSRTSPSSAPAAKNIRAAVTSKRGLPNNEGSAALNNVVSQPLAPIGTGPLSTDSQAYAIALTAKPVQTSSYTSAKRAVCPDSLGLTLDGSRKVDGAQSSLGSWGGSCTNQSVMSLTQTQLEEAMKRACFDTNVVSVGDQSSSVSEPILPLSSVPTKATTFSPAASPISSLLAGEKIQFGAVTSPTILTPSTHVVSQGIRSAPSSLDMRGSLSRPASENCGNPFDKEKHLNESCRPLEDCEAEAAASAVAVTAIGNDEVVGNAISSCSSVISDPKRFGSAVRDGITTGMAGDQHTASQSKAEETLSVSLPADLSVETPPISIWPPLPSPHSSFSQMLSPFPGGPASHFPFYDMNQMMGSPVFAFGPGEESGGPPPQPQKTSTPSSGPLGTWQQCHTGVDSFYGPPAGFTAPFISPPGSIPGVQGPPNMVVYNHFAPVGQFGQVGLSYMGTTYIPSGKQPDWKHNPTSTTMGGGEVEINNLKMVSVQRNTPSVPAQVQHLAPGSPLLSMPSPLAMYEVSPFQASSDVSTHPRWSHVQAPPVHTIPHSVPLQQRAEIAVPSHFSHGSADHPSSTANGFSKLQTSSPLKDGRSFAVDTNPGATEFPGDIGLVDPPLPTGSEASANLGGKGRLGDSARVVSAAESSASKRNPQAAGGGAHKTQLTQQKNSSGQHHYSHYQRGGQKNSHGAEWSNRKMGFHGTYPAKVKQVYVAKQSTSGNSTNTIS